MINVTKLAAQIKKDGKEVLIVRNIDEMLYITNRHYMIRFPLPMLFENSMAKVYQALVNVFGRDLEKYEYNIQYSFKNISEPSINVSQMFPGESARKPAKLTPILILQDDKGVPDIRLVKREDAEDAYMDQDYASIVDGLTVSCSYYSDMVLFKDESYELLILRYRLSPDKIEEINSYTY